MVQMADPAMFNKKVQVKQIVDYTRIRYPNIVNAHQCDMATDFMFNAVQKIYPDVEKFTVIVGDEGDTSSHAVLLADNKNIVIDSQLMQFKDHLALSDEFVEKGVYDIQEYKTFIKDYYNNL